MLFFHPGTKRQSKLFTCKLILRPDKKQCFRAWFYSADNKKFRSMASVARYFNLSVPAVSPHPPLKEKICAPKLRFDANKKMTATQKKMHVEKEKLQSRARRRDVVVEENDTKKIGEVGYKFRKQFGSMGWFTGTVVKKLPKPYYLRRCVYTEDGEFEDLRLVDLVELAKLDKKSTVSSKQSTEKVIKKNRASVINQAATSLSKKRTRAVAKGKHPTLRKTNQFVTLLGKKTGKHVTGRCQCKDCEGKVKGNNKSTWVCSACTRDGGVDPKQWWLCGLEKRPECWLNHCRDMHSF